MDRTSTLAWGFWLATSTRCGSVSRMALLSACILPSAAIEPEQSATMKKCSGRAARVEPGRSVMSWFLPCRLVRRRPTSNPSHPDVSGRTTSVVS